MKLLSCRFRALLPVAGAVLLLLVLASPALAQVNHGTFNGTTVDFVDVTETTQLAVDPTDPAILYGVPTTSGDQLVFNPPAFTASATTGNGKTADQTLSLLNVDVVSTAVGTYIETLSIKELGDSILTGFGTGYSASLVTMSGWVYIKEANGVPIAQVDIPIVAVFSQDFFELPGDSGSINWSGEFFVDVASYVPNATRLSIALNNYLEVYREGTASATIQKKVSRGVVISVPEPGGFTLIGLGLLFGIAAGNRRRR